jgi:hypothetical protein
MAGHPPTRYPDRGSREGGYQRVTTPGGADRDVGYPDGDDRSGGYRTSGTAGYPERPGGESSSGSWDDGRHARGEDYGGGWRHDDHRTWDAEAWGWADEDPEDGGYRSTGHRRDGTGGAEGNERLAGLVGSVLLILFAVEGFTILSIHKLLTLHFFLGMLLIGPVALKACSVLYRFVRYYTGAEEYRRKGPPAPLLRVLGPLVLLSSLAVLGTGVMLAITGPSGLGTWLFLHRAAFVAWFCVMTVHVLTYVWRLPELVGRDLASRAGRRAYEALGGRWARWLLLVASILAGLLLAVLTVHRTGLWFAGH